VTAVRQLGPATGLFTEGDGLVWVGAGRTIISVDPSTGATVEESAPLERAVAAASLGGGGGGLWFVGYDPSDEAVEATIERYDVEAGHLDISVDSPRDVIVLTVGPDSLWTLNVDGSVSRVKFQ
jgi:hypothetical protein